MTNEIFPKEKELQAIELPLPDNLMVLEVLDPVTIKELTDIFSVLIQWRDEYLNNNKIKEAA